MPESLTVDEMMQRLASLDKGAAGGLRIYEYMDRDGNVYWSFTQEPGSKNRRLTLQSIIGKPLHRFVPELWNYRLFQPDEAASGGRVGTSPGVDPDKTEINEDE